MPPGAGLDLLKLMDTTGRLRATSAADVRFAARLAQAVPLKSDLRIRLAREAAFRDVQEHNLILLGGRGANPWVSLFDGGMNFALVNDPETHRPAFRNRDPKRGEQETYITYPRTPDTGEAYAVVTLLRHPDHSGHVLIIQGATMEASEGAARLLMNGDLRSLKSRLGRDAALRTNPRFEVLLRMKAIGGGATEMNVVAARTH